MGLLLCWGGSAALSAGVEASPELPAGGPQLTHGVLLALQPLGQRLHRLALQHCRGGRGDAGDVPPAVPKPLAPRGTVSASPCPARSHVPLR